MSWLLTIILAYLLFALVSLGDRYLLLGSPEPKTYTFYVGTLGIAAVILAPFTGFFIPSLWALLICFSGALAYILFLYLMYSAIEKFEVSRVIPAVGALIPLITLVIIYLLSGGNHLFGAKGFIAFFLLILGSVAINLKFSKTVSFRSLGLSSAAAFFASLGFVFSKYAYLLLPFWTAFIWMRIFAFLIVLFFLFNQKTREEVFKKKEFFTQKTFFLFVAVQVLGASAFILQNWAINLAGLSYLPIINALQGAQYAFLFLLILLISRKLPLALKENISKKIVFQKISAIIVIGAGLILLAFN